MWWHIYSDKLVVIVADIKPYPIVQLFSEKIWNIHFRLISHITQQCSCIFSSGHQSPAIRSKLSDNQYSQLCYTQVYQ